MSAEDFYSRRQTFLRTERLDKGTPLDPRLRRYLPGSPQQGLWVPGPSYVPQPNPNPQPGGLYIADGYLSVWAPQADGSLVFADDSLDNPGNEFVCLVSNTNQWVYLSGSYAGGGSATVYNYDIGPYGKLTPIPSQASIALPTGLLSAQTITPDTTVMLFPLAGPAWGQNLVNAWLVNADGSLTATSSYSDGSLSTFGTAPGAIAVASDNSTVYLYNPYRQTVTCLTMSSGAGGFILNYVVAIPHHASSGNPCQCLITADDNVLVLADAGSTVVSYNTNSLSQADSFNVGGGNVVQQICMDDNNNVYAVDNSNTVSAYAMDAAGNFSLIGTYASSHGSAQGIAIGDGLYAMCTNNAGVESSYILGSSADAVGLPVKSNTLAMPALCKYIETI